MFFAVFWFLKVENAPSDDLIRKIILIIPAKLANPTKALPVLAKLIF